MPNIIRMRDLGNETNLENSLFVIDKSEYGSNTKKINISQLKEYIVSVATSGTSGTNGTSGTSGTNGTSGSSGTSGTDGTSGSSGSSGTSGTNGTSGTSGTSGSSGTSFDTITNAINNRVLTSDGSTNSANAESALTFDGSILAITGNTITQGFITNYTYITSAYTALTSDCTILCYGTSPFTLTLPAVFDTIGQLYTIKNQGDSVTIEPNGTELIEYSNNYVLNIKDSIIFQSNGNEWIIISSYKPTTTTTTTTLKTYTYRFSVQNDSSYPVDEYTWEISGNTMYNITSSSSVSSGATDVNTPVILTNTTETIFENINFTMINSGNNYINNITCLAEYLLAEPSVFTINYTYDTYLQCVFNLIDDLGDNVFVFNIIIQDIP